MPDWWILPVIASLIASVSLTDMVRVFAKKEGIVDRPDGERKKHAEPTPLMGGLGIYIAILLVSLPILLFTDHFTAGDIDTRHFVGFFVGGAILMIGGYLDDRFVLSPSRSMMFPLLAAWVAVISGIGVSKLTNPLGGDPIQITEALSGMLTFVWLIFMMYTTKLLDGLDGLAAGVSAIGALVIALLAVTSVFFQPDVALFAAIVFAAFLGFLFWNTNPAKIFLGDGGSTFVGFSVGVLAIISGSKILTALLVLGVPALDIAFVIMTRFRKGKSITKGDREHLHHKLFDLGYSQRSVVLFYYVVAIAFGAIALIFESWQKLIALVVLGLGMLALIALIARLQKTSV